jgi:hypothetical protein
LEHRESVGFEKIQPLSGFNGRIFWPAQEHSDGVRQPGICWHSPENLRRKLKKIRRDVDMPPINFLPQLEHGAAVPCQPAPAGLQFPVSSGETGALNLSRSLLLSVRNRPKCPQSQ